MNATKTKRQFRGLVLALGLACLPYGASAQDDEEKVFDFGAYQQKMREQAASRAAEEAERAAQEQRRAALIEKIGYQPGPSIIKRGLRRLVTDPDSVRVYRCGQARDTKSHWEVVCEWGAKNSFGGMVKKTDKFIVRNNIVGIAKR